MAKQPELDEDDLVVEEVERRTEPRGFFPDMVATVLEGPYAGRKFPVDEASRRGLFLKEQNPDSIPLGTRFVLEVEYRGSTFRCHLEVARKEIQPRRGVAGRLSALDQTSQETLDRLLAAAAATGD